MGLVLELRDLDVWRPDDTHGDRQVIHSASLCVEPGETVALVGPNGAGKTSLLLALVGATPFEGRVSLFGEPLTRASLSAARNRIGFVFADPSSQLFCDSVAAEVVFGLQRQGASTSRIEGRRRTALEQVGLEGFDDRVPQALSLGEQRRLALACAIAEEPDLLLLDEPTANLDPRARAAILRSIASAGKTTLVATHDLEAVLELQARVVLIDEGHLRDDGPAADLLADASLMEARGLEVPLSLRLRG